jgi:hypothetical protein
MKHTALLLLIFVAALSAGRQEANAADTSISQVQLEESWRSDPDEAPYFRSLSSFILHHNELYVMDKSSAVIYVYSTTGELLRRMDVRGEGPGELVAPTNMMLLSEKSIGLMSAIGPRLVIITLEGEPSYEFANSEVECYTDSRDFSHAYSSGFREGKLYFSGEQSVEGRLYLARCDLTGFVEMTYMEWPLRSSPGEYIINESDSFVLSNKNWCTGDGGRVYVAEERCGNDHYNIVFYEGDDELFTIEQPYTSRRRSEVEKAALEEETAGGSKGQQILSSLGGYVAVDDYDPDVVELVEIDGILWVRTSRSEENEGCRTYELFDREGQFLGQRHIAMKGANWKKDVVHFLGDYAVLVKGEYDAKNPGLDPDPDQLQFILTRIEE